MTMFLVGGGPADSLDHVHDEFVSSAKARGTRVGVAMLGSQDEVGEYLAEYADPIRARWPEVEIVPIWLDDEPNPADNETQWPDDLAKLAGLVVCGGWTPGYLTALAPQRPALARLVRGGTPYLGFSAGAMVVSKHALIGGWRYRGRQIAPEVWSEGLEELEVREGLGLIGPVVDVHTDVVFLDRMLATLELGPATSGVAIDEGTCLVIDPGSGRTRVEGSQRVHWISREQGASVVRHESSPAELARHEKLVREEAERQQRLAAEAREQEAREQEAQQAQPVVTVEVEPQSAAPEELTPEPGTP